MKQGDKLTVKIIDYTSNGEGIAKDDGYVIFVPFVVVGETVKIRITFAKKSFAFAVLEEIVDASPLRLNPPCNRFTRCGGCDILHIDYAEQLKLKKQTVQTTFSKNYKGELNIDDVVPSVNVLGYRNKVSLPFGIVNDKVAVGFYRENTHKIVSITKCFLQGDWIEKIIQSVLEYANENHLTVYDENTGKGLLRYLVARNVSGYIMITIVATAQLPKVQTLTKKLQSIDYVLYQNINRTKGNVVLDGEIKLLAGNEKLVKVRNIELKMHPFSFLQVNDYIRDKIYDKVESLINASSGTVVIDAYAGVGILGANLAKNGARVYNLEIVPEAVNDAKELAKFNGLDDYITCICCDSKDELPKLVDRLKTNLNNSAIHQMKLLSPYFEKIKQGQKKFELRLNDAKRQKIKVGDTICFTEESNGRQQLVEVVGKQVFNNFVELFQTLGTVDTGFSHAISIEEAANTMLEIYSQEKIHESGVVALEIKPIEPKFIVVLDPPRKGCDNAVLDVLKALNVDIIYISCNPATLSRDMNYLMDTHLPQFLTPYDMFPNTRHLECLTYLKRKQNTN